jgi:hypothetical protein
MASVANAWSAATGVRFVHRSEFDGSCNATQNGVLFDVRPVSGGAYLAARRAQRADRWHGLHHHARRDAHGHPAPRTGSHAGLPPRAHPSRGPHLLRGQQLGGPDQPAWTSRAPRRSTAFRWVASISSETGTAMGVTPHPPVLPVS